MRSVFLLLTALALVIASQSAVSLAMSKTSSCCDNCICSTSSDCGACPQCRWDGSRCVMDSAYSPFKCCGNCDCTSPGECEMCGCCVNYLTLSCSPPPCGDDTTSSSSSSTSSTRPQQTTSTTTTSSTTTTTFYEHPDAEDLLNTSTTSTTSSTSTTTTTPSSTTTTFYLPPTTTSTTVPAASCSDGLKNQFEEWVDCGGPCPQCPRPDVSAEVEVEDEADSGDRVEIEVRITSNESGNVVVDLRLPEGLESDSPTTVRSSLEGGLEQVISFEAEATEYLPIGEYEIILEVRDVRNLVIAEAKKTIVVKEAPLIKLPKIDIELPFVGGFKRVISAVQERLFSMVKNTTQIIYATTWLAPILILVLAGFAYLFHIWRR